MHNTIPSSWKTARLFIHDLKQDDIEVAQGLYEKSAFMEEWTGQELDPNYISHCLLEGDLPPMAKWLTLKFRLFATPEEEYLDYLSSTMAIHMKRVPI